MVPKYEPSVTKYDAATQLLSVNREKFEQLQRARLSIVYAARRQGMTLQQIADRLGVTEGAVRYMLKQYTEQNEAA